MTFSPTVLADTSFSPDSVKDALDGLHHGLQTLEGHRPLVARLAKPREHLAAVERLASAVLLHDEREHLLDALVGGEARGARLALAPPADDVAGSGDSRIDHLALEVRAERTLHAGPALSAPRPSGVRAGGLKWSHRHCSNREKTSEQFVPPKPKELLSAFLTLRSRATSGT